MKLRPIHRLFICSLFISLLMASPANGFSILAHEAIIDAEWETQLKPMLLKRYPTASADDLKKAHGYAYGGALVADMGYMPFGQPYFTNLLHYVRSGDMVKALIDESSDLNEYAFALGAISHYMADKYGHSLATNKSVPIFKPELKEKFGDVVTYEDDNTSHSRMELAYDVIQVARGHYASTAYHDFIGFNISKPVLERAFLKTYGEDLNKVFPDLDGTIRTFRWGVRDLFPAMLQNAWKTQKNEIRKIDVHARRRDFRFRMPKRAFDKEFGIDYKRPNFKARAVAFIISILPKRGALKKFKFRYPGKECEALFKNGMDSILVNYALALHQAEQNKLAIDNINFDTGKPANVNEYHLADKTYDEMLLRLEKSQFNCLNPPMHQAVLKYYYNSDSTKLAASDPENGKKAIPILQKLRAMPVQPVAAQP